MSGSANAAQGGRLSAAARSPAAQARIEKLRRLGLKVVELSALDTENVNAKLLPLLKGRTALLLGDGAPDGATLAAAMQVAGQCPAQIVLAGAAYDAREDYIRAFPVLRAALAAVGELPPADHLAIRLPAGGLMAPLSPSSFPGAFAG